MYRHLAGVKLQFPFFGGRGKYKHLYIHFYSVGSGLRISTLGYLYLCRSEFVTPVAIKQIDSVNRYFQQ